MTKLLLILTTACAFLASARGDSWPEFRGPTGQGIAVASGLPIEWSDTKNVVWKQPIPGRSWSSPVLEGQRIYLTTAEPVNGDHSLRALCLDSSTGKTVWQSEVFREGPMAPSVHGKNSHASPTPLVHGQRLFVHFGHQGTACLDLSGNVIWRNTSLRYRPVHGNGGSPILVDDKLIFSCDGGDVRFIVALDAATGKVLWKTNRPGDPFKKFSFSTPLSITVQGKKQVVSPASDRVSALDPETGREIWWVGYDGYSVVPRPVFSHGLVFISTGFGSTRLLAIRPDGEGDLSSTHIAWKTSRAAPLTPSMLLVGDELYMVSDGGTASCLDAVSGRVHWQQRLPGNYSSSPIYGDGKVYFQSEEGLGTVIKAGKKFEELSRNPLHEKTLASYAVADGAFFIRTEHNLYRIQAR